MRRFKNYKDRFYNDMRKKEMTPSMLRAYGTNDEEIME